jgi:hypothetical protein
MPKPQGRCIFCTGTGLTKEHVFPDWLNDVLPRGKYNKHERLRSFDPARPGNPVVLDATRIHQGGPANRRVRVVCGSCNSGWMGNLQDRAKPVLVPLIRGESCAIGAAARNLIASWTAMTAMTAELMQQPSSILPRDRDHLWREGEPPSNWQIWMGYYDGSANVFSYAAAKCSWRPKSVSPAELEQVPAVNTQTTSMFFGKLYLYVFSSAAKRLGPMQLGEAIRPKLHPIWPPRSSDTSWPCDLRLTEGEVGELKHAILRTAGFLSHG